VAGCKGLCRYQLFILDHNIGECQWLRVPPGRGYGATNIIKLEHVVHWTSKSQILKPQSFCDNFNKDETTLQVGKSSIELG
jgi:hypothetical protein